MSKATHNRTTSPRLSPSRRTALLVGIGGLAALPTAAGATEANPWAPTALGRKLLSRLPAYATAMHVDCNTCDLAEAPDYDAAEAEAAERAVDETSALVDEIVEAIFAQPVTERAHLTDLAIVFRSCGPEEGELHDGLRHWGTETIAGHYMTQAILKLAGVPAASCSLTALCREAGARLEVSLVDA